MEQNHGQLDVNRARGLYIDLLKRALLDDLYADEPMSRLVFYRRESSRKSLLKSTVISLLERFLLKYKLRLVTPYSFPGIDDFSKISSGNIDKFKEVGSYWPIRAHTMIGRRRLDNLRFCVETVLKGNIPGDLIETGVWRGGACIFMRAILAAYGETGRTVWLADSFQGLPAPDPERYEADADDPHHTFSEFLAVARVTVEDNFRRYGLLDSQVRFLEGWFKDTLPSAPIDSLAVLRLDGDMYESTIQALEALYDKLSPGGFVIIDDHYLPGCAKAVADFRSIRGISDEIIDIDGIGAFWRRSHSK